MPTITLVTGNAHKLAEYKRLLPANVPYTSQKIDLDEIQSFDLTEIVTRKVKQAFAIVKAPVIVEDVSAGLNALYGLPGPFVKFFEERLGQDALYQLVKDDNTATVICTNAYYDGSTLLLGTGTVEGTIVSMRTDTGFGFDNVFVPNGQALTYAQMGMHLKDQLGHRGLALRNLLSQLKAIQQ